VNILNILQLFYVYLDYPTQCPCHITLPIQLFSSDLSGHTTNELQRSLCVAVHVPSRQI